MNETDIVLPPHVSTIFDPFTQAELNNIAQFVILKLGLLTTIPDDTMFGRYLYSVDFLRDSKATVLQSLDQGKSYAAGR
jgi:hypothetical protein